MKDSTRLKLAALGIAAAALGLSFVGFPKVGFVAGVSWVAAMLSTLSFQRLKMRSIILTLSLISVSSSTSAASPSLTELRYACLLS